MNFYKELERECISAGLSGKVIPVPQELRPTNYDYADLERRIAIRVHENEIMMAESELLAARTALN